MRLNHLLQQGLQRHIGIQGVVALGLLRQLGQYAPAPLGLLQDQGGVLGRVAVGGRGALKLLGHHLDGRQRRAQLVRRRRRQPAQGRQPLLTLQHVLGRGQGQFQLLGVGRHPPGVAGGEHHSRHQGHGHAEPIEQGQVEILVGAPGQGLGPEEQHPDRDQGQQAQQQGLARGQGRRGDRHRRHQQQAEGVLQPAGQAQQQAQLEDVEPQMDGRGSPVRQAGLQSSHPRHGPDIDRRADGDDDQAGPQGQWEVQALRRRQYGHALAQDRQPAQDDQGPQRKAAPPPRRLAPTRFGQAGVGQGSAGQTPL
ncbi:hypothetical protein BREV_BREV_03533 [Brevundimonas mediterranea]|uniref:Uncharacterized protein n=1 Tax=Brevundimonas mediterranea TaxID=74329 RepID=A0A7Z8Y1V7_9CAUL|nr:hypothetical protein BREV_BREV_03533 [Brevundimonas mediterranea]